MSVDPDLTITHAGQPPADPTATVGVDTAAAATPPAIVPGYRLECELGRGGMGVVYLATQDGLNRKVALKMVLSGEHASQLEKGRFLAEAEAVAAVRHPGVVQVYDFGTHDGRPYFALEYLPGGSLSERLNGTPLPATEAAKLVAEVGRAVQAAHDAGIIHRDLKPGNILFDADGQPNVTDFGLARKGDTSMTATGAVLGTPSYMAPEQAEGRKDVGPSADVYALGAVLYECLTGRPPFRAATPLETIHQVMKDEPVAPSKLTPNLPRDLETVCLKCIGKDPEKRYATAGAMADDLTRYLNGEPILARPVSAVERGWRWVRRNPLLAAVVVGGPLLLAVTVVVVLVALLMTAAANVKLAAERQKAQNERTEAEHQRTEAERQKHIAHTRLEKAIEAVDRMLARAGSERWARTPGLQTERRQVLEDAVAFFNGFSAEDSADPLVRKETAKAHFRVAAAYKMLGELPRAKVAAAEASRLYSGLLVEFPNDAGLLAATSEVYSIAGDVAALSAEYAEATNAYGRALEYANRSLAEAPDSPACKFRVVEARSSFALANLQRGRRDDVQLKEMTLLAREIGTSVEAPFEHRLALAFALTVFAQAEMPAGREAEAQAAYGEAAKILASLADRAAPSGMAWERYAHTLAVVTFQVAYLNFLRTTDRTERIKSLGGMKDGINKFDELLQLTPTAFPFRYQKYDSLCVLAHASEVIKETQLSLSAHQAANELVDSLVRDFPHMDWLPTRDVNRRARYLVLRVRADTRCDINPDMAASLRVARASKRWDAMYSIACANAIASITRPPDGEKYAKQAMALLNELYSVGYFRNPNWRDLPDKDTDLDPLRDRDDFKAFLERVKNAPVDSPKPK